MTKVVPVKRSVDNHFGIANAYLFWIVTLMFALPLLIAYYAVRQTENFIPIVIVPYVAISCLVGLLVLRFIRSMPNYLRKSEPSDCTPPEKTYLLWSVSLCFLTASVVSFGGMKYSLFMSNASPSELANIFGAVYLLSVSLATVVGFPVLLTKLFPSLSQAVRENRIYLRIGVIAAAAYFFTYLILVNQILITGYNAPPFDFVSSPTGAYPFAAVFTAGPPPSAVLESLVYVPFVLIQFSQSINLILQPFELVFAIILADLIASTIILTRFRLDMRSDEFCLTGAAASGFGGILGFTSTCPSCLVPTLVSAFFGGASSIAIVQSAYSSLYGVLLPPMLSIVLLLASLFVLNRRKEKIDN